ncbi:MAG: Gfo/Idh/MocA family oxidoreductase [Actinomycetes bacterium]
MSKKLRVGVVGTGLIAQVMHLHFLRELSDQYEIAALCDLSIENAETQAAKYGVGSVFTDWREMLASPIDAVLILTSGNHAEIAVAAAKAGRHVFVEKPMCYSVLEAKQMVAAAAAAGVTLMVGYPKRYDPAYARFLEEVRKIRAPRMLRVTTYESALAPYIAHYPLSKPTPPSAEVLAKLAAEADASVETAISDSDPFLKQMYSGILLDTLVHEINAVRGVLGEPSRIDWVSLSDDVVTVMLKFGSIPVAIHWVNISEISRYRMEFSVIGDDRHVTLAFPSPFLRNAPAVLEIEDGVPGTTRSSHSTEISSYESAFKCELEQFYRSVTTGVEPLTSGSDGLRDIAICQAIIECFRRGAPVDNPTGASS